MHLTNIEQYMTYLFSAALKRCGNFQDAEDLTSEVLLAALNYPKEIKDLKSWLSGVLNHKYYDMLRKKYKQPAISINLLMEEEFLFQETATHDAAPPCQPSVFYEATFSDIPEASEKPTEEEIRREVVFLSAKYREVIVRHYLNGEKVQDIADSLHIPKGTVLSRPSTGREQMKKGFDSMERYEKQSYQPEKLELSCNGSMGMNHEPWSLVEGDLMKLLYVIDRGIPFPYTGLDPLYLKSIPHLVECGVLHMVDDKPVLAIPVITKEQCTKINDFFVPNIFAFADLLEPLLHRVLPDLKVPVPKHLNHRIAEFRTYRHNQIPMAVIREAVTNGEFHLPQHMPPMVLMIED